MDTLNITALSVETKIGVYGWEQRINQRLLIDISIPFDFKDCKDSLSNTLDYADLCQTVTQFVESTSFQLIETVAEQIAQLIKQKYPVSKVSVAVTKPHAVKNAAGIQVVVNR
ncbi:TPA: dihydroneopterin aldolase [Legionella pneumophila]|nr:dihydroneopterin aldolase [Legionella pneumophila]HAT9742216.1 dihydroneopterin aldolase [Legionella pneumophila subsp. pneumophila]HAT8316995.1 dihydroneopterin aldolase [Legionella pneumophila]HAT8371091.1 dihydroneopterin aldolase [Legionella pneumophila]HBD9291235.1 dihydroneopterin aldolase [Legionella pneumophila]